MKNHAFHLIFFIISIALYITFLVMDALNMYTSLIKYISIIACFFTALFISVSRKTILPVTAMALTLFADTYLLLLDTCYIAGVTAFAVVQTLYAYHIGTSFRQTSQRSGVKDCNAATLSVLLHIFLPRLITYTITFSAVTYYSGFDIIIAVSMWSYINLIINTIQSFRLCQGTGKCAIISSRMLAAGMLLFLGCDTCVGLMNMSDYVAGLVPSAAIPVITYLIWVFYLPSQVLIVSHFSYGDTE